MCRGGQMCERSQQLTFWPDAAPLIASSAGSHASPGASPVRALAPTTRGTSGRSTPASSESCAHNGSSPRTCPACAVAALISSSATWRRSATPAGRSWWVLTISGRATDASGSGLWPTPCAMNPQDGEGLDTWAARRERLKVSAQNGNGCGVPLAIAVQMWATPTVCGNHNRKGASPTSGDGLAPQVKSSTPGKIRERLNPRWVAQLMGLPADWLDGVERP